MIDNLKVVNDKLICLYQNKPDELKKQLLIKKILKEKDCFKKMDVKVSLALLKDLRVPSDKVIDVYRELI
jgi:hypothetical protein